MPRIVDSAARRGEIRAAALRVFARRGVASTGLVAVAEAAGVGRSSLYHYYRDKSALVGDLVASLLADEERLFNQAAAGEGPPLARIEALVGDLVGLFEEWSVVGRALLELRSLERARFRGFFRRIRESLASLIAEGQRRGEVAPDADPALCAATLIGAVDGLLLQHFVDSRAFPDRGALRRALVRAVRRMLRP